MTEAHRPRGLDPAAVERRIREYESFGIHRTGWPGDERSALWLADELAAVGVQAELERFSFPAVVHRVATLSWTDRSVEGVPLYDAGFTGPEGIHASLAPLKSHSAGGRIVVAPDNDRRFWVGALYDNLERLEQEGAVALVLPRSDPEGDIVLVNAARIDTPLALPVFQVAAGDCRDLHDAAEDGQEAVLIIAGERRRGEATNVVATLPGADPDLPPVGIMTPRSGWFTCASERGGGIAIFLALAEAAALMPVRRRTVHLVASSGHELNHYGLSDYLRRRPGIERKALAWLHLGANIGTATGPVFAESIDPALHAQAGSLLAEEGVRHEMIEVRGGEALNIAQAGGRYLSLRGGNRYFHSPNDTFDRACDPELVAAAGRAALRIVEEWLAVAPRGSR